MPLQLSSDDEVSSCYDKPFDSVLCSHSPAPLCVLWFSLNPVYRLLQSLPSPPPSLIMDCLASALSGWPIQLCSCHANMARHTEWATPIEDAARLIQRFPTTSTEQLFLKAHASSNQFKSQYYKPSSCILYSRLSLFLSHYNTVSTFVI